MKSILKQRSAKRSTIQANGPSKIADTSTLAQLNTLSIANDFNRNLSDLFFENVDPRGTHELSVLMIHEHAQMQPVAPHYRCQVLAKMRAQKQPAFVILDLPIDAFRSLEDAVRRTSGGMRQVRRA